MVFLSVGKPMRLNETTFELKGYCIWFAFKIKTKDRWAPKHVWFVSCELASLWKWIGKNNRLDRAALICAVLPGPPNKCEISVGRIWEVLEPYNFILLIQTGAEVVIILTLHGLHCKYLDLWCWLALQWGYTFQLLGGGRPVTPQRCPKPD